MVKPNGAYLSAYRSGVPIFSRREKNNCLRNVTARLSGEDDLFYKWTNEVLTFENISFIAPGVPLTLTAITLLDLVIVLSLFYDDLNDTCQSSIKTDTQACVIIYTALA